MAALLFRTILVVVALLTSCLAEAQGLRVVARVNDDAITDFDLNQRVLFAIRTTGLQDSPELRQRMAAQILRQMIDERLQIQAAKRLGLKPTDSEMQQRFNDIERAAGLSRGQFRQYLQSVGVPFDIATQQIEAQIAWGKIVRRKVRPQVDVSEAEIDDALNRMKTNVGKTEFASSRRFSYRSIAPTSRMRPSAARIASWSSCAMVRRSPRLPSSSRRAPPRRPAVSWAGCCPDRSTRCSTALWKSWRCGSIPSRFRSSSGWHILYVVDRRPFAVTRPDDLRLNLTQMTLPLPANASPEEVARATADAQKAMQGVKSCNDLHARSRELKGATSGDLNGIRVGDLQANREMYEALPKLSVGGTAGPFRVAEGLQVVVMCGKSGGGGLPTRETISQQLLLQKLEAASRRYMRDLRRQAMIDIKQRT